MSTIAGRMMAACAAVVMAAGTALAADGTWTSTGNTAYGTTNNWLNGVIADGVGATLTSYSATALDLPAPALGARTNVVLGNIVVPVNASVAATITMSPGFGAYGHTDALILDSGIVGVPATLRNDCITNTARMKIRGDIQLKSDLFIAYGPTNRMTTPNTVVYLTGNISEDETPRALVVSNTVSGNQVSLFGDNTFSGDIDVRQGIVRAQSYTRLGGVGRQFGRDNTIIATNEGSQIDLGGFTFGPDQSLILSGYGVGALGVLAASQQSPCYTSVWSGAITLAGDSAVGMGWHQHYPRKTGSAIALTGTIDEQGAGRKLIKNSLNALYLRGTNTYSGNTIISNGYLSASRKANLGTGQLVFSGGALLFETPWDITTSGVVMTNVSSVVRLRTADQNVTFNGGLGPFTSDVYKSGLGSLTLTRTGIHNNMLVTSGALNLDYTTYLEAKLPTAWYVNLHNNASLNVIGGAVPFTNTILSLRPQSGCAAVFSLSGAAGTRFNVEGGGGGWVLANQVQTGASLDLRVQAGTEVYLPSSALDAGGVLLSRVTYNSRAFVGKSAGNVAIPFASASTAWDTVTPRHMDVTTATPALVPANALIRTLRFDDPTSGQVTLQGNTSLTNGAILVTPAMGANAVHIQGGTLTSWQNNELIVHQYNTQAVMRISSILTNTPSGGALILTKTGPGTLILSDVSNTFSGVIYVLGGTLEMESTQAFGATNRYMYVYNGATLRLRGQHILGVGNNEFVVTCNEAGGKIDVPDVSDSVRFVARVGMKSHGVLTKTGKGMLTLSNWTRQSADDMLTIPSWNYVVEDGTLDIGTGNPVYLGGENPVRLTVKNNAVLRGGSFLYGKCANNGNGSSEDDQGMYHLYVDETGGTVDLNGVSATMGVGGNETYSSDVISGPGRLTITNSSVTAATVSFNGAHNSLFTGVFDGARYHARNNGGGLPNGEFFVPAGTNVDFAWVAFPYTIALGRLTGSGTFGGKCQDNQSCPPLLIGRDMDETFEYSGYLWGTYNGPGNSAFPFRYAKVGSNAWRISGATNAMVSDVAVRSGTILVGADSPGQGSVGALGKARALLGDIDTGAGNSLALLTDGPYTVGNTLVVTNTNPGGTTTLGGNQTAGASLFTSGLILVRDVTLTSANTDSPNGVTFSGPITGPGSIFKTGVGPVYLTGPVSNAGPTTVQAGRLVMPGNTTLTNTLTVAASGTNGSGTFAVSGDLTLGPEAQLVVSGVLDRSQTYTLVTWTGTRIGSFVSISGLPPEWRIDYRSNSLVLYVAGGTLIRIL
jgi:autotransporter-associated beta strand protein